MGSFDVYNSFGVSQLEKVLSALSFRKQSICFSTGSLPSTLMSSSLFSLVDEDFMKGIFWLTSESHVVALNASAW